MSKSKQYLLDAIEGARKRPAPRWWCIVIEQTEGGGLIATQGGERVPNGSISPNDNAIFINESGTDKQAVEEYKKRLYK